jgi:hypothetical protein
VGNVQMVNWPTATTMDTMDAARQGIVGNHNLSLPVAAKDWPTPISGDAHLGSTQDAAERRLEEGKATLSRVAETQAWTTPQAHDVTMRGSGQVPCKEAGNACLARDATTWPTPDVGEVMGGRTGRGQSKPGRQSVAAAAIEWPTPRTEENCQNRNFPERGLALSTTAMDKWATPTSRDHKDGACDLEKNPVNGLLGRQVLVETGQASPQTSGPRRLNPAFVEWLMGWPQGWTDFAPVGTEWSRWLRLMRSELSRLN